MSNSQWSTSSTQDTSGHWRLMWVWFWASTVSSGVLAGIIYGGSSGFSGGAMFGGFLGGAIAAIPALVVVDLLVKMLIEARARSFTPTNELPISVASPLPTDQRTANDAAAEVRARSRRAKFEVESRLVTAGVTSTASLLDDPLIAEEAREIRRVYGENACASFFTRKASDLGLGDVEITTGDIPDKF
jgi:hypothetical protein